MFEKNYECNLWDFSYEKIDQISIIKKENQKKTHDYFLKITSSKR